MITDNNNDELRISTINISEAGPETVQLPTRTSTNNTKANNSDLLISLTPINVVAPIKKMEATNNKMGVKMGVEGELELEMAKLHELLEKQELAGQAKINELETKFSRLTGQSCVIKERLKGAEERELALANRLKEQEQSEKHLKTVMSEYQALISKLTIDLENIRHSSKSKIKALTEDKESALLHLNNVEAAFSDVHQKYEKCKKVMEDYKRNEASIKSVVSELEERVKSKEQQLQALQQNASQQVDAVHRELQRMQIEHEQEFTRLRAQLRKTDLKVLSLQEALEQKVKENQELTVICDDLIAGKGST